jgi:hypothetical protein
MNRSSWIECGALGCDKEATVFYIGPTTSKPFGLCQGCYSKWQNPPVKITKEKYRALKLEEALNGGHL